MRRQSFRRPKVFSMRWRWRYKALSYSITVLQFLHGGMQGVMPLADEAGLVRAVGGRCVAPAQAVADNEDNAADNATIGIAGNAVGNWEEGLDPLHLGGREQENISHGGTSAMG